MCDTGKICYENSHKASVGWLKTKTTMRKRGKATYYCHPYRCHRCGMWHNTSMPKEAPHVIQAKHTKFKNGIKRRCQREAVHPQAD